MAFEVAFPASQADLMAPTVRRHLLVALVACGALLGQVAAYSNCTKLLTGGEKGGCLESGIIAHGRNCTTYCTDGYAPSVDTLKCIDGKYYPERFTCLAKPCPVPADVVNQATVGQSCKENFGGKIIKSGSKCTPNCARNHHSVPTQLQCVHGDLLDMEGVASTPAFECYPDVSKCEVPIVLGGEGVVPDWTYKPCEPGDTMNVSGYCRVMCQDGYHRVAGSFQYVCDPGGLISAELVCQESNCPVNEYEVPYTVPPKCAMCPENSSSVGKVGILRKGCKCDPGFEGDLAVDEECTPCDVGFYKGEIGNSCTKCPEFATTEGEGSTSMTQCKCMEGYSTEVLGRTFTCKPKPCIVPFVPAIDFEKCMGVVTGEQCKATCSDGYYRDTDDDISLKWWLEPSQLSFPLSSWSDYRGPVDPTIEYLPPSPSTQLVDGAYLPNRGSGDLNFLSAGSGGQSVMAADDVTVAVWLKVDTLPSTSGGVLTLFGNQQRFLKVCKDTRSLVAVEEDDDVVSSLTLEPGVWSHVVAIWEGNNHNIRIILNGVEHSIRIGATYAKSTSGGSCSGGSDTLPYGGFAMGSFEGLVSSVRVYNSSLPLMSAVRLFNDYAFSKVPAPLVVVKNPAEFAFTGSDVSVGIWKSGGMQIFATGGTSDKISYSDAGKAVLFEKGVTTTVAFPADIDSADYPTQTVEAWIKMVPDNGVLGEGVVIRQGDPGRSSDSCTALELYAGDAVGAWSSTVHHYVVTVGPDGSVSRYVDGTLRTVTPGEGCRLNTALLVGSPDASFLMGSLRLYGRSLTPFEVTSLFRDGDPMLDPVNISPGTLVASAAVQLKSSSLRRRLKSQWKGADGIVSESFVQRDEVHKAVPLTSNVPPSGKVMGIELPYGVEGLESVSMEAWVKLSSVGSAGGFLMGSGNRSVSMAALGGSKAVAGSPTGAANGVTSVTGAWTHVVGVFERAKPPLLFLDGVPTTMAVSEPALVKKSLQERMYTRGSSPDLLTYKRFQLDFSADVDCTAVHVEFKNMHNTTTVKVLTLSRHETTTEVATGSIDTSDGLTHILDVPFDRTKSAKWFVEFYDLAENFAVSEVSMVHANPEQFFIGQNQVGSSVQGWVSTLRIYEKSLSISDVLKLYKFGHSAQATADPKVGPAGATRQGAALWLDATDLTFTQGNASWPDKRGAALSAGLSLNSFIPVWNGTFSLSTGGDHVRIDGLNISAKARPALTMEAWVNVKKPGTRLFGDCMGKGRSVQIGVNGLYSMYAGEDTDGAIQDAAVVKDQWSHVVSVWEQYSESALYLNGRKMVVASSGTFTGGNGSLCIGGGGAPYWPVDVRVSSVRVYGQALAEDQVIGLYHLGLNAGTESVENLDCLPVSALYGKLPKCTEMAKSATGNETLEEAGIDEEDGMEGSEVIIKKQPR